MAKLSFLLLDLFFVLGTDLIEVTHGEVRKIYCTFHADFRIMKLSRPIFSDREWGHQTLDCMWRSCYYIVLHRIRTLILSAEQRSWALTLISTFIGEMSYVANEYSQLRATCFIYIGDLRRYAWMMCRSENDKILALIYYR